MGIYRNRKATSVRTHTRLHRLGAKKDTFGARTFVGRGRRDPRTQHSLSWVLSASAAIELCGPGWERRATGAGIRTQRSLFWAWHSSPGVASPSLRLTFAPSLSRASFSTPAADVLARRTGKKPKASPRGRHRKSRSAVLRMHESAPILVIGSTPPPFSALQSGLRDETPNTQHSGNEVRSPAAGEREESATWESKHLRSAGRH
nr:uncharacterized protein LOC110567765 [Aotus nancymaae]